jgi:hypothetical protein
MKHLRFLIMGGLLIAALAWEFAPAVKAASSINLSAYEFLLGTPCTIGGEVGKCGVSFGGWTGGGGAVANGWTAFPGNRQGLWAADINYTGSPAFGGSVTIQGGNFDLFRKGRLPVAGTVTGGTVTWPASASDDISCGEGVATVTVNVLTKTHSQLYFQGCLHDLPAGSVIPPKIWGTLTPGI